MWIICDNFTQSLAALKRLYDNDVEKVELFVGGMLLSSHDGEMAEIFQIILKEQILRLRDGDRYEGYSCCMLSVSFGYYIGLSF